MKSIFFSFRRVTVLALGAILVLTTSCEKDEVPAPTPTPTLKNITEIVVSDTSFSLLKQAVVRAGLADALSTGSLTVFAPNNAAFRASGIDSSAISLLGLDTLVDILTYHVVGSKIMSTDLQNSQAVASLQGDNLYVSKNDNGVFVNGIKVNAADINASNGVIHVIEKVILNIPAQSIAEIVSSNPDFSLLKQAVLRAGLANALSTGSLTVFAPNNAAFQNAGINSAAIESLGLDTLVDILKYHVIGSKNMSTDLQSSQAVASLQGANLYVSKNNNGVFVNGIKVNAADINASNGVIHVIEKVILDIPTKSIAEIVSGNPDFSTLLAAVAKAGLASVFSGSGNYTVFAPTNDAFAAAGLTPEVINDPSLPVAAVVAILKAHVIGTNVFASDLIQGATAPTLQTGVTLTIGTTPPSIKIVGGVNTVASNITEANIIATNGVIHVIDKVLR